MYISVALYSLAAMLGSAALAVAALIAMKYRSRALVMFALFLAGLAVLFYTQTAAMFARVLNAGFDPYQSVPVIVIGFLSGAYLSYIMPRFAHALIAIPWSGVHNAVFGTIALIFPIALVLYGNTARKEILYGGEILPFAVAAYAMIRTAFGYRMMRYEAARNAVRLFFIVSAVVVPLIVVDILFIPGSYIFLVYYASCSLASIIYAGIYFFRPEPPKGISPVFMKSYGITAREKDIIDRVLGGLSNQAIADELGISLQTVKNGISAIYQKTASVNRTSLAALVHEKSSVQ